MPNLISAQFLSSSGVDSGMSGEVAQGAARTKIASKSVFTVELPNLTVTVYSPGRGTSVELVSSEASPQARLEGVHPPGTCRHYLKIGSCNPAAPPYGDFERALDTASRERPRHRK